eukprot:447864-Amphidinium_carterae.1
MKLLESECTCWADTLHVYPCEYMDTLNLNDLTMYGSKFQQRFNGLVETTYLMSKYGRLGR